MNSRVAIHIDDLTDEFFERFGAHMDNLFPDSPPTPQEEVSEASTVIIALCFELGIALGRDSWIIDKFVNMVKGFTIQNNDEKAVN